MLFQIPALPIDPYFPSSSPGTIRRLTNRLLATEQRFARVQEGLDGRFTRRYDYVARALTVDELDLEKQNPWSQPLEKD